MRKLILLIILFTASFLAAQTDLPTCYYTYAQISQMLSDYEAQHPDIAKKVLLGYTQQDNLPIYAMRISDNVNLFEEEPGVLLIGQVHAEEVLGVQVTMSNIQEILANRYSQPYSQWINQLDIWLVPTLNPEGHNVVTANIDTSWRKNKRDNNNNGIFDFVPLVGYDIDGVDINRNFGFNWVHGDTLMQPGGLEVYDYYRGPAPMSESEVQAIADLADQVPFVFSICWHSSRTGNLSEKVYYPFNWKEIRPSPDRSFAQTISDGVAAQIQKEAGGAYESLPNLSRKGAFHDWMYQQYGTIQLLIEVGTRNLQPDSLLMVNTVNRASNGVRWLLNRTLPFSTAVPSSAMLTGNIRDAVTNQPIQAEFIIEEHHAPWFRPRLSSAGTGRYWRPLPMGSYTVRTRARGYYDTVIPGVTVNNTSWTMRHITMQPKPPATIAGSIRNGNILLNGTIKIQELDTVTLNVNGEYVYQTHVGTYPVEVYAEGYYPYIGEITVGEGYSEHHFQLSPEQVVFGENWENNTSNWVMEGPWVRQNELSASGYAITDSWGGFGFYEMNCNVWIKTANPIMIPAGTSSMLHFDSHLYTEYIFDPVFVEVSTDGENWTALWQRSGQHDIWKKEYISLSQYAGASIYLRFRLTDQSTHVELTDPGWTIDNIKVVSGIASSAEDQLGTPPLTMALYPNYPNPFNPETRISFALAIPTDLTLEIFNIKGQKVRTLARGTYPAGAHNMTWNGRDDQGREVASGVYMYRLSATGYSKSMKMMLLK